MKVVTLAFISWPGTLVPEGGTRVQEGTGSRARVRKRRISGKRKWMSEVEREKIKRREEKVKRGGRKYWEG
jgi:hypothetical protein